MNTTLQQAIDQDRQARARIETELDRNFLVEAAAGTGKTTSMVDRMVAMIASGKCHVQHVTAVTFTRKAAAELRERFQGELRRRADEARDSEKTDPFVTNRLMLAADNVNLAFIGTIHSFCAAILRERPIEFGVDPGFRELDEGEDRRLREQAWHENIAELTQQEDPLLQKLKDLAIERSALKSCYDHFIEYRDIEDWPCSIPDSIDLDELKRQTRSYIEEMRQLLSSFPKDRGNDELMDRYEEIVRASSRGWTSIGRFFSMLSRFDSTRKVIQKIWATAAGGSAKMGKQHDLRWNDFRSTHVKPAMNYWYRFRYSFVVDFLRRAVKTYERVKRANGGLDFQDLLLTVSRGLRNQAELRSYFQNRYRHLLVDEFQDTDPIQAEMMLYLTSTSVEESDWTKCVPKPGSLFLVGDPKQSIYRFRRGDIVTFNRVKEIITASGGEVLALAKNFRSRQTLIDWNNHVYAAKFNRTATQYSPAAEDMLCGREDKLSPEDRQRELSGLYRLELPVDSNIDQVHAFEADSIARFIRHAIDSGMQVHRTKRELQLGKTTTVRAGDFLIVPRTKKCINLLVAALEKYGIPYDVAGGNPLSNNPHLRVLIDCLRAIDDPSNPVPYLAVLREFFGLSDRELYLFKQAGGSFNYSAPLPNEVACKAAGLDDGLIARLTRITTRLQKYQRWLRSMPYPAAVSLIGDDLGLFAAAAASSKGNMQTGGLFKAIEWMRAQSWDFDSANDLIEFLDEILVADDTDGCPALAPDENVVRLMNLHKAKGLEAPIVFLADTTGRYRGEPNCHIDRRGSHAKGYMGITEKAKESNRRAKEIATPEEWSTLQEEEKRFLAAEEDRLLYVATTRAGSVLIVSIGRDDSRWGDLHPYLQDAPKLEIPQAVELPTANQTRSACEVKIPAVMSAQLAEEISAKWSNCLQFSYDITTAKKLGLKGSARPRWETSGDYGHDWGSAVHELLDVCQKSQGSPPSNSPSIDLRPTALRLALDHNLGVSRVDELIATVQSVTRSDIWCRAQAAERCYSELPIETCTTIDGLPTIVRGVMDLIFEETSASPASTGWVIVDYKTDDISPSDIPAAVKYYRSQLEEYAKHWQEVTRTPTKEIGLYFTKLHRYERIA